MRSLQNPNYRRYQLGHVLSNTGTWLQQTAELWLILQLTGRGTAVGIHSVLKFGPVLLFGAHGGILIDRVDRRRLLIATQGACAVLATVMAVVSWMQRPPLMVIYALVLGYGLVKAIDNPLRKAFVRDLVADSDLSNAVSLESSVGTFTRTVGPALAGILIAQFGVAWCFTINVFSYVALLLALLTIRRAQMRPQVYRERAPRQVRQGLAYAWSRPAIREALLLCLAAGMFAWNWNILVPFYATEEFGGDAALFGLLLSLLSLGAFIGALYTARLATVARRHILVAGALLAVALGATALAPTLWVGAVALVALGMMSTALVVGAQARIQLRVEDWMSGRVLALFSIVFVGSKPVSGLLGGWLAEVASSRAAFGLGSVALGLVVTAMWLHGRARSRSRDAVRSSAAQERAS